MANPKTATEIASWAEAHTDTALTKPNAGKQHLKASEIADILRMDANGLSQEAIAASFDPPKAQSSISRCLRKWGPDRTAEAKRMIRAIAPSLVTSIARSSDQKSKAVLLKGVNVLEEQQAQGITVHVGRGGMVNLGTLVSPPSVKGLSEGQQNT